MHEYWDLSEKIFWYNEIVAVARLGNESGEDRVIDLNGRRNGVLDASVSTVKDGTLAGLPPPVIDRLAALRGCLAFLVVHAVSLEVWYVKNVSAGCQEE